MAKIESYLGWKVDYANPVGEPALLSPDSVAWRVYKNPIALAVGGICAVLLEFADARIRSGVWDHSIFKVDPIGRSMRTGTAAMVGVYGPESAARRVIQGVNNMHTKVTGKTPDGEEYRALDVELLDWVSATASYGFLTAYDRFVKPLSEEEKDNFFQTGQKVAVLYGVKNPITSEQDFHSMMMKLEPRFEPHPINREFLDIMRSGRANRTVPRVFHRVIVDAAVDILPPVVRERLGLEQDFRLSTTGRLMVKGMGWLAETIPNKNSPAALACERLGLPRDFLWKSEKAQKRMLAEQGKAGSAEEQSA